MLRPNRAGRVASGLWCPVTPPRRATRPAPKPPGVLPIGNSRSRLSMAPPHTPQRNGPHTMSAPIPTAHTELRKAVTEAMIAGVGHGAIIGILEAIIYLGDQAALLHGIRALWDATDVAERLARA